MLRPFAPNLVTLLASGPHKTFAPVQPDSDSLALPTISPLTADDAFDLLDETLCRFSCPRLHLETIACL
jgi:hypothetical protein